MLDAALAQPAERDRVLEVAAFVFRKYKPRCFYWEFVIVVRKVGPAADPSHRALSTSTQVRPSLEWNRGGSVLGGCPAHSHL